MKRSSITFVSLATLALLPLQLPAVEFGLVAHYPLNGDAVEAEGRHEAGALTGTHPVGDRFGRENGAVGLGRDCLIEIPTAGFKDIGGGDFSVSFWFRIDATMPLTASTLLRSSDPGVGSRHGIMFWLADAEATKVRDSVGAEVWADGQNNFVVNDFPLSDGKWHHLVLVRNGDSMAYYVNGLLAGVSVRSAMARPVIIGDRLILGNGHCPYDDFFRNRFVGAMDDLRLYSRPLTQSEVVTLWRSEP